MLGITGPLVSRVRQVITDDLGRWTGFELLGRDGKSLVVLCAYQVCQKGGRQGTFTAFSQQITILRRRGIDRPNPRRQFVTDLISLLEPYVLKKADILLLGDFNESRSLLPAISQISKRSATAWKRKNQPTPEAPIE